MLISEFDVINFQINEESFDVTALGYYSTSTKNALNEYLASSELPANIKILNSFLSKINDLPPTRTRWGCWNVTRAGLSKNQQDSGYLNAIFWTKGTLKTVRNLVEPALYAFQSANNTDNRYIDLSEKTVNSVFGTPVYSYAYEDNDKLFDKPDYAYYENDC